MSTALETLAAGEFEQLQLLRRGPGPLTAVMVVHDTRCGPGFGGIRCRRYADPAAAVRDALALAQAMTLKCAITGLPAGGAKTVILDRDGLDRAAAFRLVGDHVEAMAGRYYTGPDLGTTDADLLLVAERTAFVARPDAAGPGDLADSTAVGVFAALRATAGAIGRDIDGLRVAVQGLGAVGMRLARRLHAAGARLSVADVVAGRAAAAADELAAEVLPIAAILGADCDVLAPCAGGGVLDREAATALRARAVCGAANNVFADAATGRLLHARGIPVAPDFVANAGALLHGATFHLTGRALPSAQIAERLHELTTEILQASRRDDQPPGEVALARARARLAATPPSPWFARRRS